MLRGGVLQADDLDGDDGEDAGGEVEDEAADDADDEDEEDAKGAGGVDLEVEAEEVEGDDGVGGGRSAGLGRRGALPEAMSAKIELSKSWKVAVSGDCAGGGVNADGELLLDVGGLDAAPIIARLEGHGEGQLALSRAASGAIWIGTNAMARPSNTL